MTTTRCPSPCCPCCTTWYVLGGVALLGHEVAQAPDRLVYWCCNVAPPPLPFTTTTTHAQVPTEAEALLVRRFRGDRTHFREVEKFFYALSDVPDRQARVAALAFRLRFQSAADSLAQLVEQYTAAIEQVGGCCAFSL